MCCCAKPNINGEPGYSWDGVSIGTRTPSAPDLKDGDVLLFDEPGRCGGMDCHCHHFRLLKSGELLVRHGGGDERMRVSLPRGFSFEAMDSNARYWMFHAIHYARRDGVNEGLELNASRYRNAFVEGRLKKRKMPGRDSVKVWIEPKAPEVSA